MNKDLEKIIKGIKSYQNEDICLIMLTQKENKALLNYINNLQKENKHLKDLYNQALKDYDELLESKGE